MKTCRGVEEFLHGGRRGHGIHGYRESVVVLGIEWRGICLYRIAQEALQNIARHAPAKMVHIERKQNLDGLVLSVRDDGIGSHPNRERELP